MLAKLFGSRVSINPYINYALSIVLRALSVEAAAEKDAVRIEDTLENGDQIRDFHVKASRTHCEVIFSIVNRKGQISVRKLKSKRTRPTGSNVGTACWNLFKQRHKDGTITWVDSLGERTVTEGYAIQTMQRATALGEFDLFLGQDELVINECHRLKLS